MAKQVYFNSESRDGLKRGIDTLANAVKVTLGPKGRNVVIDKPGLSPIVTKDGVSVAKEIELRESAAYKPRGSPSLQRRHRVCELSFGASCTRSKCVRQGKQRCAASRRD